MIKSILFAYICAGFIMCIFYSYAHIYNANKKGAGTLHIFKICISIILFYPFIILKHTKKMKNSVSLMLLLFHIFLMSESCSFMKERKVQSEISVLDGSLFVPYTITQAETDSHVEWEGREYEPANFQRPDTLSPCREGVIIFGDGIGARVSGDTIFLTVIPAIIDSTANDRIFCYYCDGGPGNCVCLSIPPKDKFDYCGHQRWQTTLKNCEGDSACNVCTCSGCGWQVKCR